MLRHRSLVAFAAILAFAALEIHAQTVSLQSTPASGAGSVTPTLTWSTQPPATSCAASGGWTGTKAASGSQAAAPVTSSTSYTLTCQFAGDTTATLTWIAPTQNTDATPLTDLASYTISYGPTASAEGTVVSVDAPATQKIISNLPAGVTFFAMQAVNKAGLKSAWTPTVSKTTTAATSVVQSTAVSVSAPPPATPTVPTGLTVK